MKPAQVLDEQLDLLKWWKSDHGVKYADAFLAQRRDKIGIAYLLSPDWGGIDLADAEAAKLDAAETYWVNDTMCALIEDMAQRMPNQPLLPSDLLTPTGFVWFNTPIQLALPGMREHLRAVTWAPVNVVVGEREAPWSKEDRAVALTFYWDTFTGDPEIDPRPDSRFKWPKVLMLNLFPWRFGQPWDSDEDEHAMADINVIGEAQRFMAAFWAISQDKVAARHRERDRGIDKRSRREGRSGRGRPRDDRGRPHYDVEVITLRREYEKPEAVHGDGNGDGREYDCWWFVDPYWATRHFKDGPRKRPVVGHPKGDLTKPFKPKADRVRAVRR